MAGYVSPRQTVVAGLPDEVDAVIAAVTAQERFARRVNMEVASHTALMDPVLPDIRAALADLTPRTPNIPFLSTVTDPAVEPTLDADYWVANVRQPVRFSQAITAAAEEIGTFVEVSANPILTYAISDTLETGHHHSFGTLARDADDTLTFHTALNTTPTTHAPETLHVGEPHPALPVHALAPHPPLGDQEAGSVVGCVGAPRRYRSGRAHRGRGSPARRTCGRRGWCLQAKPYPSSHRFAGVEIVPLSVLLQTLSLAAAECGAATVNDVRFDFPIAVDQPRVVQVFTDGDTISVSSADSAGASDARWVRHVSARISYQTPAAAEVQDMSGYNMSGYDPSALAELHNAWGIDGQAYPWTVEPVGSELSTPGRLHAVVDLPDGSLVALLDAAVNLGRLVDASSPGLKVPSSAGAVAFRGGLPDAQGAIDVRARGRDGDDLLVDIAITSADGTPCVDICALRYTAVEPGAVSVADADPSRVAHALDWQPWTTGADAASTPPDSASIAVLGDSDVAGTVRERLLAAGHHSADAADARYVVYVADPAGTPTSTSPCASPPRSPISSGGSPSGTPETPSRCGSSPAASTRRPPTRRCARAACGALPA